MPNQVPKIDVVIDTSEIAEALQAGIQIVAVLGFAASGTANTPVLVRDTQTLEDTFGKEDLAKGLWLTAAVKKAFEGGIDFRTGAQVGAAQVYAVRVGSAVPTVGSESGVLATNTAAGASTLTLHTGDGSGYTGKVAWYIGGASPEYVSGTITGDVITLDWKTQYDHTTTDPIKSITFPAASSWQSALAALSAIPTVGIVVVTDPTDSATVDGYLKAHVEAMELDEKFRVGILGHKPDATTTTLNARATALDDQRVTLIAATPTVNGEKVHSSLLAAAFAGKLVARPRPTINMNSEILKGFDGMSGLTSWTLAEQQTLLTNGSTPVVVKGSDIVVVRWVTTFLTLDGLPSDLFKDGSEYEVFRYVAQQLMTEIDANYKQKANTATVRRSIANFIDGHLEQWKTGSANLEQFLDSYVPTTVIVDPNEPRGVIETVGIKPVAPLHFHTIVLKRIAT